VRRDFTVYSPKRQTLRHLLGLTGRMQNHHHGETRR
jgi:hypothetical protein